MMTTTTRCSRFIAAIALVVSIAPQPVEAMPPEIEGQQWSPRKFPASSSLPDSGRTQSSPEVIGGNPSHDQRVVGLLITRPGDVPALCSGVLISNSFVLTAAHCFCHKGRRLSSKVRVTNAGNLDPTSGASFVTAIGIIPYPGSSCRNMLLQKDLALVRLAAPKLLGEGSGPFALRSCGLDGNAFPYDYTLYHTITSLSDLIRQSPSSMWVEGYGYQGDTDASPRGERQRVKLKVSSIACVGAGAKRLGCRPFEEMILGASRTDRGNRDACKGDSGGPVFIGAEGEQRKLAGIVSRSVHVPSTPGKVSCLSGGIFTHLGLPSVLSWLASQGVTTQPSLVQSPPPPVSICTNIVKKASAETAER